MYPQTWFLKGSVSGLQIEIFVSADVTKNRGLDVFGVVRDIFITKRYYLVRLNEIRDSK